MANTPAKTANPGKVQASMWLPRVLYRKVKKRAVDEGSTVSSLVERALRQYCAKAGTGA